jgi:penicillin-binding protein 2
MNKPIVRTVIVGFLAVAVMAAYVYRLMNIQIVQAYRYQEEIGDNVMYTQTIKGTRGEIVLRGGEPLAVNRMGYNVIIDMTAFPRDYARGNEILAELIRTFEELGEEWTDGLPISRTTPYRYETGRENEIASLKRNTNIIDFATAEDAMYWLVESYGLENYPQETARKIAGVRYEMARRGANPTRPHVFATDIQMSSVIQIKERSYKLAGVNVLESAVRIIENGTVAPHLVGLVGPIYEEELAALKEKGYAMDDVVGKSGSELAFEDMLRGKDGERTVVVDTNGAVVEAVETNPPVPGNTIVLSIDKDLQQTAQTALPKQIKYLNENAKPGEGQEANAGAVAVIECKTGRVLAAATYPTYDLNRYYQDYTRLAGDTELRPLYNRALFGTYAPGSCFKPVVATAGLGQGIITPSSTFPCHQVFQLPGSPQRFTCLSAHGAINVVNALRFSCNIFFYTTGNQLGIETVDRTAKEYGLGEPTGIELPEVTGARSNPASTLVAEETEWYPGDTLQSSIGQLYHSVTPLQLANYAATIGNRGTRMKLTVVDEIRDYSRDTVVKPFEPIVEARVSQPPEAFETVIEGLVAASRIGTAQATFGSYPIDVASKTGTPETAGLANSTFICFAPAEDPVVAVAVVIENGWHGYTGAPVARDMLDAYFGFPSAPAI